jgi:hypothetical protein
MKAGKDFYALELLARQIDQPVPDDAVKFPDLKRLPAAVQLTELGGAELVDFLKILRDGWGLMAKLALAAGPEMRSTAEKVMPKADWDTLRKRDAFLVGRTATLWRSKASLYPRIPRRRQRSRTPDRLRRAEEPNAAADRGGG